MADAIDEPDRLAPLPRGGEPIEKLLRKFFSSGKPNPDHSEVHHLVGREVEESCHERWRHDKVVRSTHGVNCTAEWAARHQNARGMGGFLHAPWGEDTAVPGHTLKKHGPNRVGTPPNEPGTRGRKWRRIGTPY